MPRQASGSFDTIKLEDGTRAFRLRFPAAGKRQRVVLHERPSCECGCGGSWTERAARDGARQHARARARRRVGADARRRRGASGEPVAPTFHEYASAWLRGKVSRRPRRQADRRQHRGRLPLAADPAPAAVLRLAPHRRDRPRAVPRLQGAQAPGGGRAARGAGRRRRPQGSSRPAGSSRSGRPRSAS